MVRSPSVPPNSSTTSAMWVRERRMSSSMSSTGKVGATNTTTAQNVAQVELLGGAPVGQHVLDVDHADHVVERFAIDRIARMRLGLDQAHDLVERRVGGDADDVDARHHDVGHGLVAQLQDVGQQHPLVVADRRVALGRLLDQLLDRLAHRLVLLAPAQAPQDGAQQAAARRHLRNGSQLLALVLERAHSPNPGCCPVAYCALWSPAWSLR